MGRRKGVTNAGAIGQGVDKGHRLARYAPGDLLGRRHFQAAGQVGGIGRVPAIHVGCPGRHCGRQAVAEPAEGHRHEIVVRCVQIGGNDAHVVHQGIVQISDDGGVGVEVNVVNGPAAGDSAGHRHAHGCHVRLRVGTGHLDQRGQTSRIGIDAKQSDSWRPVVGPRQERCTQRMDGRPLRDGQSLALAHLEVKMIIVCPRVAYPADELPREDLESVRDRTMDCCKVIVARLVVVAPDVLVSQVHEIAATNAGCPVVSEGSHGSRGHGVDRDVLVGLPVQATVEIVAAVSARL